jgi:hypothetical protein
MKSKRISSAQILSRNLQAKIKAGDEMLDSPAATCSKDCGVGKKPLTCEGVSCTTTTYGCYAQNATGGISLGLCAMQ